MRKTLLVASLLALLLMSATLKPLAQLTIINKSGSDIALQLRSVDDDLLVYYLRVPEGTKDLPTSKTFTVQRDLYYMQLYYVETYDPVYGFKCATPPPTRLYFFRNTRIVFLECGVIPRHPGEPSQRKYFPPIRPPDPLKPLDLQTLILMKRFLKWQYIY